jgi:hypothetical protein
MMNKGTKLSAPAKRTCLAGIVDAAACGPSGVVGPAAYRFFVIAVLRRRRVSRSPHGG